MQSYATKNYQDSNFLVAFADKVSDFVGVLQQFSYSNDLFSSHNLKFVACKLSFEMQRNWFGNFEKTRKRWKPTRLMEMNSWVQE